MGRTRAFDEQAVLTDAMHAFRRKGYRAVSVRDLEDATGLAMGSIYNSFGDKAGLFAAAFEHYNASFLKERLDRYAPPEAGLRGLRDLFLSLLQEPNHEAFGCLITNSAVELGRDEPKPRGIEQGFSALVEAFTRSLKAARAAGALRPRIDPKAGALKLLALHQGILVLVRAGQDKRALARLIRNEFADMEMSDDA